MKRNISLPIVGALVVALVLIASIMTRANSEPTITGIDGKSPNGQNQILDPISQTPTFTGEAPAGSIVSIYNQTAIAGAEEIAKIANTEPDLSIVKTGSANTFTDDFSGPYSEKWLATNTDLITQENGKLAIRAGGFQAGAMDGIYSHSSFKNGQGQNFIQGTLTVPNGFQANSGNNGPNYTLPIIALSNEMSAAVYGPGPTPEIVSPGVPAVESETFNPGFNAISDSGIGGGITHPYIPLLAVFLQENGFLQPMQPQQYSTALTPEIQTAISAFEQAAGLPTNTPNGLSSQTADFINNLSRVEPFTFKPAGGYEIVILQIFLNVNGFTTPINGFYSQDLVDAMRAFQGQNGLPQTGNYDSTTLNFINSINPNQGGNQGGGQPGLSMRFGLRTSNPNQGGLGGDLNANWDDTGTISYTEVVNNQPSQPVTGSLPMNPGNYTIRLEYGNGQITIKVNGATYVTHQVSNLDPQIDYTPYFALAGNDQGLAFEFDDFTSNLVTPSTYSMAATGMQYSGTSYSDPVPFMNNAPGVVIWSDQSNFSPLPIVNASSFPIEGDVYVYLTKLTIPAGMLGNPTEIILRWTNYAGDPNSFKNTVSFFNTQVGVPFAVEAYAKAFTRSGDVFTPTQFPIENIGQINEQGEILPPANTSLLIARTSADQNGTWTAEFGKDEFGAQLPHLDGQTLSSIAPAPYSFIVYAVVNGQTFASLVPITADSTGQSSDTTPPVSTHDISGQMEEAPYEGFYKDSATITLAATDENGGSGLQKIVYSLSGAMEREETDYTGPITITVAGETTITFRSIDNAGNGETPATIVIRIDKDTDGDGVYDNLDYCTLQSGNGEYQGCPFGINIRGKLRVHYSGKTSGYAAIVNGKQKREARLSLATGAIGDSRQEVVDSIDVKVFDTDTLKSAYGKNLGRILKKQCESVFDTAPPVTTASLTNTTNDVIGVPGKDSYVVAIRTVISEPDGSEISATTCRSIAARAFRWTQTGEGVFAKTPGGKLGQGTVARPRAKFTKTVKAPKNTCTADDDQDSPDDDDDDNERDIVENH